MRERMSRVLRSLQGQRFLEFTQLFNPLRGVADLVVTFLAILELARESLVQVTQHGSFAPIYVRAQMDQPNGRLGQQNHIGNRTADQLRTVAGHRAVQAVPG